MRIIRIDEMSNLVISVSFDDSEMEVFCVSVSFDCTLLLDSLNMVSFLSG
jgi:hypothetical protein